MTEAERCERAELLARREELERRASECSARIEELEGRPAAAAFYRELAKSHDQRGVTSVQDAYLAMRAEQFAATGKHYVHESASDREAIEAAAKTLLVAAIATASEAA